MGQCAGQTSRNKAQSRPLKGRRHAAAGSSLAAIRHARLPPAPQPLRAQRALVLPSIATRGRLCIETSGSGGNAREPRERPPGEIHSSTSELHLPLGALTSRRRCPWRRWRT
ncbi:hypothetical protein EYF80_063983 [Liparis tanakae]|uniref:Uncharacterized protein n=1 Tax=Liparis tanakae TaxID=230148 RepID=A0A4Z2EC55_9TELE|nr:hypothetical protein EYF80_063983 [Liparis tanakae]